MVKGHSRPDDGISGSFNTGLVTINGVIPKLNFDFIIVEKEENLVEEDENPPNEPEPIPPKPTTTNTGSSLVIPEDAKSSSNVENSRISMKVNSTENTNHRLR